MIDTVRTFFLVVLATPVDTIPLMAVKALNHVTDRQVVMDMGGVELTMAAPPVERVGKAAAQI